jgi:hypothetical protein
MAPDESGDSDPMRKIFLLAILASTWSVAGLPRFCSAELVSVDDNVLSDGVLQYLTMEEVGDLTLVALQLKLAGPIAGQDGWRLGTRQEFYDMAPKPVQSVNRLRSQRCIYRRHAFDE